MNVGLRPHRTPSGLARLMDTGPSHNGRPCASLARAEAIGFKG